MFDQQMQKVAKEKGFIAALDQSGGSTPKALKLYGIEESAYSNDNEMFDMVHQMRTRIITNKAFDGRRILGAILFENTLDRDIEGINSAKFLWENKQVVPFLKVDKGLAEEQDNVQIMKPMPGLDEVLDKAKSRGVFGTKMRSVVKMANEGGIARVIEQQFDIGKQILAKGLVPIIEPEVDINSPEKSAAEAMLKAEILKQLEALSADLPIMLKLTLPEADDFYKELVDHDKVLRVVALSGGYSRDEANARCSRNHGVIASFSRAFTQGLSAQQSEDDFTHTMDESIESIYDASKT